MIPANRTCLLQLREKHRAHHGSLHILQARQQALLLELLRMSKPFLHSRREIRDQYGIALAELAQARRLEGAESLAGLAAIADRRIAVELTPRRFLGIACQELRLQGELLRAPSARGYDWQQTTIHLDQAISHFEQLVVAMVELARFEHQLKRLSNTIIAIARKIKIIEEKILPRLRQQIHHLGQRIGEREREEYFRLKRFKKLQALHPSPARGANNP